MAFEFGYVTAGRFINGKFKKVSLPCVYDMDTQSYGGNSWNNVNPSSAFSAAKSCIEENTDKFINAEFLYSNLSPKYATYSPGSSAYLTLAENPEDINLPLDKLPENMFFFVTTGLKFPTSRPFVGPFFDDIQMYPYSGGNYTYDSENLLAPGSTIQLTLNSYSYSSIVGFKKIAFMCYKQENAGALSPPYYHYVIGLVGLREDGTWKATGVSAPYFDNYEYYEVTPTNVYPLYQTLDPDSFLMGWLIGRKVTSMVAAKRQIPTSFQASVEDNVLYASGSGEATIENGVLIASGDAAEATITDNILTVKAGG